MSDDRFVYIDQALLKAIAHGSIKTPSLYYHPNALLRTAFWHRLRLIDALIQRHCASRGSCLDFGGGSGVFLPTLARRFKRAVLLDRDARDARMLVEKLALGNVEIWADDIYASDPRGKFDAVIAADVLEHFQQLQRPIEYLGGCIARRGWLFTSLPTENWVYQMLRLPFGIKRPEDHYHTAREVETALSSMGFRPVERTFLPFRLTPLFHITAWQMS